MSSDDDDDEDENSSFSSKSAAVVPAAPAPRASAREAVGILRIPFRRMADSPDPCPEEEPWPLESCGTVASSISISPISSGTSGICGDCREPCCTPRMPLRGTAPIALAKPAFRRPLRSGAGCSPSDIVESEAIEDAPSSTGVARSW